MGASPLAVRVGEMSPLSSRAQERTPGAVIHSHIVAEMIDGRGIRQVEADSLVLRLGLALLSGFGFLIGWRYRLKRQGILLGSLATVVILAVDTIVFWQWRIILPIVLALQAVFFWLPNWLWNMLHKQTAVSARQIVNEARKSGALAGPERDAEIQGLATYINDTVSGRN